MKTTKAPPPDPATFTENPTCLLGVPFADYCQWPALHKSRLWTAWEKTLNHYKHEIDHPELWESTEALVIGHAAHTATLEPDDFARIYVQPPPPPDDRAGGKWNRTYKEHKAAWAIFKSECQQRGWTELDLEDYQMAVAVRKAVYADPDANELLKGAACEVSFMWRDPTFPTLLKGRADAIKGSVLIDLKTTQCAAATRFGSDAYKLGYHFQAALYADGLKATGKAIDHVILIAVEKDVDRLKTGAPLLVSCYEVSRGQIEMGRGQYKHLLEQIAEAQKSGFWPGYGGGIKDLCFPAWAGTELV